MKKSSRKKRSSSKSLRQSVQHEHHSAVAHHPSLWTQTTGYLRKRVLVSFFIVIVGLIIVGEVFLRSVN